jgi:hypothetical protein
MVIVIAILILNQSNYPYGTMRHVINYLEIIFIPIQ